MSLKNLHLIFISMTLGLMAFQGYWALGMLRAGQPQAAAAWTAILGFAAALAYLFWFLKEYRTLK